MVRGGVRTVIAAALSMFLSFGVARADRHAARAGVLDAITRRDANALTPHVELPLLAYNLRFLDHACQRFASKPVTFTGGRFTGKPARIEESDLEAFVQCVADLGIQETSGALTYGPGSLLQLPQRGDKVMAFFAVAPSNHPTAYLVMPDAFASHVRGLDKTVTPSAPLKKRIDASTDELAFAVAEICVDPRGKVTSVSAKPKQDWLAAYEVDVRRAVRTWKIQPFVLRGKPVAVCGSVGLGYPADRVEARSKVDVTALAPPPPPPPPPPVMDAETSTEADPSRRADAPQLVAPTVLESYRVAGEKLIVPDDPTKVEISRSGKDKVIASFKICVNTKGGITSVALLKSSGFPDYDTKLATKMRAWRYKPYAYEGRAVPVCTAITFIYTQQPPPPPPPPAKRT